MAWKRKECKAAAIFAPLLGACGDECTDRIAPRGYVPVLVGSGEGSTERFIVPVGLFGCPCIMPLLDMAAHEFGYEQQGILRIPCDPEHFQRIVGAAIAKGRC